MIYSKGTLIVTRHCFSVSSYEEAGRYLETYKSFENKPPDMLMERIDSDFFSRVSRAAPSQPCVWSESLHVNSMVYIYIGN